MRTYSPYFLFLSAIFVVSDLFGQAPLIRKGLGEQTIACFSCTRFFCGGCSIIKNDQSIYTCQSCRVDTTDQHTYVAIKEKHLVWINPKGKVLDSILYDSLYIQEEGKGYSSSDTLHLGWNQGRKGLCIHSYDSVRLQHPFIQIHKDLTLGLAVKDSLLFAPRFKNFSWANDSVLYAEPYSTFECYSSPESAFTLLGDSIFSLDSNWIVVTRKGKHFLYSLLNEDFIHEMPFDTIYLLSRSLLYAERLQNNLLFSLTDTDLFLMDSGFREYELFEAQGLLRIQKQSTLYEFIHLATKQKSEQIDVPLKPLNHHFYSSYSNQHNTGFIYNSSFKKLYPREVQYQVPKKMDHTSIAFKMNFWGVLDTLGNELIVPVFDTVLVDLNDRFTVKVDSFWGLVGPKGQIFLDSTGPIQHRESDGYWQVKDLDSNKWGTFDPYGRQWLPSIFDTIYPALENCMVPAESGGHYLPWSIGGDTLEYAWLETSFIGAKVNGRHKIKVGNRWGMIDSLGRMRISYRYQDIDHFNFGYASVKINGKWGKVDHRENLVIQPYYDTLGPTNTHGVFWAKYYHRLKLSSLDSAIHYQFLNANGNELSQPTYDTILEMDGGFAVMEKGKWGFFAETGREIVPPLYDATLGCNGELVVMERRGKRTVFDLEGGIVVSATSEEIGFLPSSSILIIKKAGSQEPAQYEFPLREFTKQKNSPRSRMSWWR